MPRVTYQCNVRERWTTMVTLVNCITPKLGLATYYALCFGALTLSGRDVMRRTFKHLQKFNQGNDARFPTPVVGCDPVHAGAACTWRRCARRRGDAGQYDRHGWQTKRDFNLACGRRCGVVQPLLAARWGAHHGH